MGKRKKSTRKPQGPRKSEPLPTIFPCLFCNHENSVSVKLDKKAGVGILDCKKCDQRFQCGINYLSAPVDVYSEWVDAAESVAQHSESQPPPSLGLGSSSQYPPSRRTAALSSSKQIDESDRRYAGESIVADDEGYD